MFILLLLSFLAAPAHAQEPDRVVGRPRFVPGEFVVKLRQPSNALQDRVKLSRIFGGAIKGTFAGRDYVVLKKSVPENPATALKELRQNPLVEYAEPNYLYWPDEKPNDKSYKKNWGLRSGRHHINAEKAWDITTGSTEMVVAIIDTGIQLDHPDLKDNIWVNEREAAGRAGADDDGNGYVDDVNGYNFTASPDKAPSDETGHGTHVAGVIGSRGNNKIGIAGVAWNVRLMPLKFISSKDGGTLANAVKAIDYAIMMGARIINCSWGSAEESRALKEALQRAAGRGILVVTSAGNNKLNNDWFPHFPSNYDLPHMLAVAATTKSGELAKFSNYGRTLVQVAAPGEKIYSTDLKGKYNERSGTSMAVPFVSGLAALVWSESPQATVADVRRRIMDAVSVKKGLVQKTSTEGVIDAHRALISR